MMAGWQNWPGGVNIGGGKFSEQFWSFIVQPIWALRERHKALGADVWPAIDFFVFDSGTVGSVTNNGDGTLTYDLPVVGVDWTPGPGGSSPRWVSYSYSGACNPQQAALPSSYDLIVEIDDRDPFTAVRGVIVGETYNANAATGTLTVTAQPTLDAITANYTPSLGSLVGAKWYIIKSGGVWTADRIPDKPDDQYLWTGKNSKGGFTSNISIGITGSPTGGTFQLSCGTSTGGAIPFNASNHQLFSGFPTTAGLVSVNGSTGSWTVTCNLPNDAAPIILLTNSLTGGSSPTVTIGSPTKLFSFLLDTSPPATWTPPSPPPFTPLPLAFNPWTADSWAAQTAPVRAARELMVFGDDSALHRLTILHNTVTDMNQSGGVIQFATQTYNVSGAYLIIAAGDQAKPSRTFRPLTEWYTGAKEPFQTHLPNDMIGEQNIAKQFDSWGQGDYCAGMCSDTSVFIFDQDIRIAVDEACAGTRAGDNVNPYFPKCLRFIQKDLESTAPSWVNPSPGGLGAIDILYPAIFFDLLGINAWTASYNFVDSTHLTISGTPAGVEYPIPVWYAVRYSNGVIVENGQGTLNSATNLSGGSFTDPSTITPPDAYPVSVVLSLGWTRYKPRQLWKLNDKTGFIPSYDLGIQDPPNVAFDMSGNVIDHTGQWTKRPKSKTYVRFGTDSGIIADGTIPFEDGMLCRNIGDNSQGPAIFNDSGETINGESGAEQIAEVPYYNNFFQGTYAPALQYQMSQSTFGTPTAATAISITDSTKNWWNDSSGAIGTILRTDSGNASSGSTTTLVDSSHVTTGSTNPLSCWWESSRFVGFPNTSGGTVASTPYHEFILEIGRNANGSTPALSWRVPIISTTSGGGGVTFTFNAQPYQAVIVVSISGTPAAGDFILHSGSDSDPIPWNASADELYAALPASLLPNVETVTGTGPWVIALNASSSLSLTSSTVVGGTVSVGSLIVTTLSVQAGDTWQLREPAYILNKWEGRDLLLSFNSSTYATTITNSDDTTLYFGTISNYNTTTGLFGTTASVIPTPQWSYQIKEPVTVPAVGGNFNSSFGAAGTLFGSVLRWNNSAGRWAIATGHDAVRPWVLAPKDFKNDPRANREYLVKDYGKITMFDFLNMITFKEIYHGINLLTAILGSPVWGTKTFWDGGAGSTVTDTSATDDGTGGPVAPQLASDDASGAFIHLPISGGSSTNSFSQVSSGSMGTYTFGENSLAAGGITGGFVVAELNVQDVADSGSLTTTYAQMYINVHDGFYYNQPPADWANVAAGPPQANDPAFTIGGDTPPQAYSHAEMSGMAWDTDTSAWRSELITGELTAAQARLKETLASTLFDVTVDFYGYADLYNPGVPFDAYGSGFSFQVFEQFDSQSYTAGSNPIVWSAMKGWGSPDIPTSMDPMTNDLPGTPYTYITVDGGGNITITATVNNILRWKFDADSSNGYWVTFEIDDLGGGVFQYHLSPNIDAPSVTTSGSATHAWQSPELQQAGYKVTKQAAVIRFTSFEFTGPIS